MEKMKVRLVDNTFSPFSRSASLREENVDVEPAYFSWIPCEDSYDGDEPVFYTDNAILSRDSFAPNAIAWLLEPRCLRPENYEAAVEKAYHFKAVLSYDQELLDEVEWAFFYPFGGSSIAREKWNVYPKSQNICMIVSDKQATKGHKLRHEIVKSFGDHIDFYGEGVGKPFDSKFEILKEYRYCVVVESCRISNYFTEKVIDCISVGTVPIYWGAPEVWGQLFSASAFCIFSVLIDLERLLYVLEDSTEHNHLLYRACEMQIKANLGIAKQYRICEEWIHQHLGYLYK